MKWKQGLVQLSATRRVRGSGSSGLRQHCIGLALRILLSVILLGYGVLAEDDAGVIGDIAYRAPERIAILANQEINESSGLAASRVERDLFWTHNDSGDKPRIFAFDIAGKDRGEFRIPKAKAEDWEDMASVTIDGKPYLVLADIGDNGRRRTFCTLYVIQEPTQPKQSIKTRKIRFRYQDGPCDCESMAIDPMSKNIFLVEKIFSIRCSIYQLAWPDRDSDNVLVAKKVGSLQLPPVTAMDISADGRRAIMATYANAYEFRRRGDESWRAAFARSPRTIALPLVPQRRQGETICYGRDSRTLYLTSERTPTPLWRIAPQVAR